jgi:hypothetical protein
MKLKRHTNGMSNQHRVRRAAISFSIGLWLLEESRLCRSILGIAKVVESNANQAKALLWTQLDSSRNDKAMLVNSSQEEGGEAGVWLRVRILNSLVFSLSTTVRGTRISLREAVHVFSARRRIIGSVSVKGTSCSNVSSADPEQLRCCLRLGPTRRGARHADRIGLRESADRAFANPPPYVCQRSSASPP